LCSSSCAITYYLAAHPSVQQKLQRELDDALGPATEDEDAAAPFDSVKKLPYLQACIDESLRLHSTSALGLPRQVPESGVDGASALRVADRGFAPGTVLSVPSYSIHRDPAVWGDDVESFRPERWFEEERKEAIGRTFNPFSYGPRLV
jgi:benzoate 4-monooxygenase